MTLLNALILMAGLSSLSSLPAAAQQHELSTQQLCDCFKVSVIGEGPAVLLIPGLASSGDVWQTTIDELKTDYQLHVFTLAGFAGIAPLPANQWGEGYLVTQQQAILAYISQQKLNKPVVVGHSLGGYLALALAVDSPQQIGAVINVDGLPALGALFAQNNNNNELQQQQNSFAPADIARGMTNNEEWQQRIAAGISHSDGMTSGRVMGELMRADLRPKLASIRLPVLTIGALQNGAPYTTPEQVQKNYQSQMATIPAEYHHFAFAHDAKHFIMADTPDWLNQHIRQFLTTHHQN